MPYIDDVNHWEPTLLRSLRCLSAATLLAALIALPDRVSGQMSGVITARDAVVDQSQQSVPLGGERYMTVGGPQPLGGDSRSLIWFDVSGYPTTIVVSEAVLYIYQVNAQSHQVNLHRVTEPWDETTATWNTRDGVTPWLNPPGGSTFDSTTVVASFPTNSIGWRAVAIEPHLVPNWLDGTWPNHGLVLDVPGDQVFLPVRFETRESGNQPQLHIRYTVARRDSSGHHLPVADVAPSGRTSGEKNISWIIVSLLKPISCWGRPRFSRRRCLQRLKVHLHQPKTVVTVASFNVATRRGAGSADFGGSITNNLPAGISILVEYSNDGGTGWSSTPVSGGCAGPAGYDRCVTHIRSTHPAQSPWLRGLREHRHPGIHCLNQIANRP